MTDKLSQAMELLRECHRQIASAPHSLGYEYTLLPKIDAFLSTAQPTPCLVCGGYKVAWAEAVQNICLCRTAQPDSANRVDAADSMAPDEWYCSNVVQDENGETFIATVGNYPVNDSVKDALHYEDCVYQVLGVDRGECEGRLALLIGLLGAAQPPHAVEAGLDLSALVTNEVVRAATSIFFMQMAGDCLKSNDSIEAWHGCMRATLRAAAPLLLAELRRVREREGFVTIERIAVQNFLQSTDVPRFKRMCEAALASDRRE